MSHSSTSPPRTIARSPLIPQPCPSECGSAHLTEDGDPVPVSHSPSPPLRYAARGNSDTKPCALMRIKEPPLCSSECGHNSPGEGDSAIRPSSLAPPPCSSERDNPFQTEDGEPALVSRSPSPPPRSNAHESPLCWLEHGTKACGTEDVSTPVSHSDPPPSQPRARGITKSPPHPDECDTVPLVEDGSSALAPTLPPHPDECSLTKTANNSAPLRIYTSRPSVSQPRSYEHGITLLIEYGAPALESSLARSDVRHSESPLCPDGHGHVTTSEDGAPVRAQTSPFPPLHPPTRGISIPTEAAPDARLNTLPYSEVHGHIDPDRGGSPVRALSVAPPRIRACGLSQSTPRGNDCVPAHAATAASNARTDEHCAKTPPRADERGHVTTSNINIAHGASMATSAANAHLAAPPCSPERGRIPAFAPPTAPPRSFTCSFLHPTSNGGDRASMLHAVRICGSCILVQHISATTTRCDY